MKNQITRACAILISFIFVFLFTKLASPGVFGRYAFIFAVSNAMATLAVFGSSNLLLKKSADLRDIWKVHLKHRSIESDSELHNYSTYAFLVVFLNNVIIFIIAWPIFSSIEVLEQIYAECFILCAFLSLHQVALVRLRINYGVISFLINKEILFYAIPSFCMVAAWLFKYEGDYVDLAVLGLCIAILVTVHSAGWSSANRLDIKGLQKFCKSSHMFCWSGFVGILSGNLDMYIGRFLLSDTNLGVYAIIKKFALLLVLPQNLANIESSVRISLLIRDQPKELTKYCVQKGRVVMIYTATILTLSVLVSILYTSHFEVDYHENHFYVVTLLLLLLAILLNVTFGLNLMVAAQYGAEFVVLRSRILAIFASLVIVFLCSSSIGMYLVPVVFLLTMVITNVAVSKYLYEEKNVKTLFFSRI